MSVVRRTDDPFVCFGAKPNKGLSSRSSTRPGVGKGTLEKKLEKGTQRRQLAKGDAEGQSTTDSRRDQSGEIESKGSEEDRHDEFAVPSRQQSAVRKTVKDGWAFLVSTRSFAKKMLVSVLLLMHRECSVTELPFLHPS